MESDLTESALFYKLWAWADKNRKQLLYGLIALAVVGAVVALWLSHAHEKQKDANADLAKVTSHAGTPGGEASPDALLKVNADYPDTEAGQRALLLAAGNLFSEGKYDLALAQFQKFLKDYNNSPFASQAALGEASCFDALGKTNEALMNYQGVVDHFGTQNVAFQAQLGMARLLEAQGKYREARAALEDLARKTQGSMIGSEAYTMLQQLNAAHPEAAPAVSATSTTPGITVTPASSTVTAPKPPPALATNKAP